MENETTTEKEILVVKICPTEEFLRKEYDGYDEDAYSSDDIDIMFNQNCEIIEVEEGDDFDIPEDHYGLLDSENEYFDSLDFDSRPIGSLYHGIYRFEKKYDKLFDSEKHIITPIKGGYITYL